MDSCFVWVARAVGASSGRPNRLAKTPTVQQMVMSRIRVGAAPKVLALIPTLPLAALMQIVIHHTGRSPHGR